MTSNLKAFGLTLVAALATSAVLAGAAQALEIDVAGGGAATITSEQIKHKINEVEESTHHHFELPTGKVTCKKAIFEGTVEDKDKEVLVTPTYSECTAPSFLGPQPVTVTHSGCYYRIYGGVVTAGNENHFDKITINLECPLNNMYIHVYKDAGHKESRCTYEIEPFKEKHNLTALNTTTGTHDVDLTVSLANLKVRRISGTMFECGAEVQEGSYTGAVTVRAYKADLATDQEPFKHGNMQVGLTVTK